MNILIVEDEAIIAGRLARLLREIPAESEHNIHIRPTLTEARAFIIRQPPDLLFLDLNLKGKDGFELLQDVVACAFQTIVVSAYGERALEAFEYGVLDFIAKPFNRDRLELALARFHARRAEQPTALRYLAVKQGNAMRCVPLDQVAFIRGAGPYAELVLRDGHTLLHAKTLERLEQLLPDHWQRIHKSYLADLRQARRWLSHEGSKYELELHDGTLLPVGRTRYKALKAKWLT